MNAPKSTLRAYLSDCNGRGWDLLAGLLCGLGNGLQFMEGQAAGYAAADAVQALPLYSWDRQGIKKIKQSQFPCLEADDVANNSIKIQNHDYKIMDWDGGAT
ncbi:hypothetical protein PVL29_026084 [Vitis rotundifolia]|uniref:Uncharacterized protein n=1 Tax=Vitis rotundifolia TaxID=103349 RepID=A0AA39D7B5_VITRO|nr:hypothetical protein PVL29_026084 [Vitis rotundifolia]